AVRIAGLAVAAQLAVGGTFACALSADGHVWCWGSNRDGAAPTGAPGVETTPVTVGWPAK
ncbi:MAG: Regulator of chromosome condensation repeat, partial [Myxococcales bacterium]|nr:Regulator of chromosome condensation repeat [Myxococcales bacterium]